MSKGLASIGRPSSPMTGPTPMMMGDRRWFVIAAGEMDGLPH